MTETQKELRWLAIIWGSLFSIGALGTSVLAALTGADWTRLNGQARFLIVVAIIVNWSGTMGAFISKAVARMRDGKSPVNGGDSNPPFLPEKK